MSSTTCSIGPDLRFRAAQSSLLPEASRKKAGPITRHCRSVSNMSTVRCWQPKTNDIRRKISNSRRIHMNDLINQSITLTTATGTAVALFGHITQLAPRRGWQDFNQDRYHVRGTNAGVDVEQNRQGTMYFLRPQATLTVFPGPTTFVVFDPRDLVKTEIHVPSQEQQSIYDDGPLLDYFHSREFKSKRRGWMFS